MKKLIAILLLTLCLVGCAPLGGQVIIIFAEKGSTIREVQVSVDDGGTSLPGVLYRSPVDVGELEVGDIDKSRRKATTQPNEL